MTDEFLPPAPVPAAANGAALPVALIHVPPRIRTVDAAWVATLAASFEDHGMDTPIVVRPIEGPDGPMTYSLVAGAHRLAAATLLDWPSIKCVVRYLDDDEARIVEIDENLMRRELDKLDFGAFYMERKAIEERLGIRNTNGGDRRSDSFNSDRNGLRSDRFTAEIAEKIGRSERTIQLAIQTVRDLDPETIALLRGTPLANNQSKLRDLGREQNPIKRRALAQAMLNGAPTIQAARVAIGDEDAPSGDPQPIYLNQLHTAWAKADLATRQLFLNDIDAAYLTAPKPADRRRQLKEEREAVNAELMELATGRRPAKGKR